MSVDSLVSRVWFRPGEPLWAILTRAAIMLAILVVILIYGIDHVEEGDMALRKRWGKVVYYKTDKDGYSAGECVLVGPVLAMLNMGVCGGPLVIFGYPVKYLRTVAGHIQGDAVVLGPGFQVLCPGMHKLWKINVQLQPHRLEPQIWKDDDGLYRELEAYVRIQVVSVELALMKAIDGIRLTVLECSGRFSQALQEGKSPSDAAAELVAPDSEALAEAANVGVVLQRCFIASRNVTPSSQLAFGLRDAGVGSVSPAQLTALMAAAASRPSGDRRHGLEVVADNAGS